jgi:hypothetical protein
MRNFVKRADVLEGDHETGGSLAEWSGLRNRSHRQCVAGVQNPD